MQTLGWSFKYTQGTHWGALGNHVRGAESKNSWGEWGCDAAADPWGTLKLGGCQFRASGTQKPRRNGRRVYGEMSVKDKGEREKRGPEASGLTPVEREAGKERKVASPSVCCVAPRKAPRGWWGAPGQRPSIGGVLHGCPSGPALVRPPPVPPHLSVLSDWLGAPWEGMALVCILQKIPKLWKLSTPLLMAGSLEGRSEQHTQERCREVPPGPGKGTRRGRGHPLPPREGASLWTRQPHPRQGQFLGSGLSPEGNPSILTFKLPGNPNDQRAVRRVLN